MLTTPSAEMLKLLMLIPGLLLSFVCAKIFYNIFLHPLRSVPGPLAARATALTSNIQEMSGNMHLWTHELHKRYGPIVRCSPGVVSFIEPEAWKEIYGYKSMSFKRDPVFYGPDVHGQPNGIIRADNESHARQRKLISHAFSDKALREQEDIIKTYVKLLIERLKEMSSKEKGSNLNIVPWYNYTAFDIMADLAFGESLGQLSGGSYHSWVHAAVAFIRIFTWGRIFRSWPGLTKLLECFIPADVIKNRQNHVNFAKERVDRRMARKTDRPDIWSFVMKGMETDGEKLLSAEYYNNGSTFMLAGTETTATLLSGLTYLLSKNLEKLERLKKEVRGAFATFEDVSITDLTQLEYLQACIEEAFRLYPPVPLGTPRLTPKGGAKIRGQYVPEGMLVNIPIYATHRSFANFSDPNAFIPERWLSEGAEKYGSDRRETVNPFLVGPRNCIGKNLAYHEIRVIIASLVLNFDLELCPESENWIDQRVYTLWDKKPLMVKLKSVN